MPRPRQRQLPGTEDALLKDIIKAAEKYEDFRDDRIDLTKKEVDAKSALLSIMKQHNLTEYHYDGRKVVIVPGEENVKVEKIKVKKAKDE